MNRNLNANEPGFLGKKLDGAEWPVDPAAWQAVSAKMSASAAAASTGAATSTGLFTKVALWVAAAGLAIAGVVALVRESKPAIAPVAQTQTSLEPKNSVEPSASETPASNVPQTTVEAAEETTTTAIPSNEPKTQALPQTLTTVTGSQSATPASTATDADQTTEVVQSTQAAHPSNPNKSTQSSAAQLSEPLASPMPLTVDFDVVVNEYDELEIQFDAILGDGAECEWNFGDGQRATGESVKHRYAAEGRYTVTVSARADDGREASLEAEVEVRLSPKLVLPNIFTPNNDGYNDLLTVAEESRNIAVERMVIIDGSGRVIFQAEGDSAAWDGGLPSGDAAPEGSYRMIVSAVTVAGERIHESAIVRLAR